MTNRIHLKLNVTLGKYKKGEVVRLKADKDGNPLDVYWRKRIQDSHHDNCVARINMPVRKKKKIED